MTLYTFTCKRTFIGITTKKAPKTILYIFELKYVQAWPSLMHNTLFTARVMKKEMKLYKAILSQSNKISEFLAFSQHSFRKHSKTNRKHNFWLQKQVPKEAFPSAITVKTMFIQKRTQLCTDAPKGVPLISWPNRAISNRALTVKSAFFGRLSNWDFHWLLYVWMSMSICHHAKWGGALACMSGAFS